MVQNDVPEKEKEKDISYGQSMALVMVFVATAAWCTVSNKAILQRVLLDSNFLFLSQGVGTVTMLYLAKLLGWVSPSVTAISLGRRDQIIIAVAYAANVAFGLCSLNYVSIPMFGALKRLTILACWVGEYFLEYSAATKMVIPALLLMTGGTVVAGWNDLEFHFFGYVFGLLSCCGQGLAFVLSKTMVATDKKAKNSLDSVLSVVFLNSVVATLLMLVVLTVTTGWKTERIWRSGDDASSSGAAVAELAVNAFSVLFLNVVIFLDCTLNTPLTHAVAGNLKAAVTSVAGLLIFATELTGLGAGGLVLNLAGGAWYSWVRVQFKKRQKKEPGGASSPTDDEVAKSASPAASERKGSNLC